MAYTLTTALKSDAAGQTLSAQLVDTTGASVGAAVTTGFIDLGGSFYQWTYAAFPDGFRGVVTFSASGTIKTIVAINPQEGENVDTKTSTRADGASYTTTRAAKLDNLDAAVSSRSSIGAGAILHTHTVTDSTGAGIDGVQCWVTATNASTATPLASGYTDSFGVVKFMLDAGAYYVWEQRAGYNAPQSTPITVA